MTKGWKNESERHSLSAKGIKTGRKEGEMSKFVAGGEDMLSKKGKALLSKYGFYEEYVPFIWREELGKNQPDVPHYITVDFVLDDARNKEFEELDAEERSEWLSECLDDLIREGYIYDVYDYSGSRSLDITAKNIRNKIDDMVLIYGKD